MKSVGGRLVVVGLVRGAGSGADVGSEAGVGVLVEGEAEVGGVRGGASSDGGNPPGAVQALARAGASISLVSGAHLRPVRFGGERGGVVQELVDVRAALAVSAEDDAKDRSKGLVFLSLSYGSSYYSKRDLI